MDASRRGDDRRQEGVTQAVGRVAIPIFLNLRPSPLTEREIKVLMEQGAIQRGVVRAAISVRLSLRETFLFFVFPAPLISLFQRYAADWSDLHLKAADGLRNQHCGLCAGGRLLLTPVSAYLPPRRAHSPGILCWIACVPCPHQRPDPAHEQTTAD